MSNSVPLQLWYLGFQIFSALVVAATGYLVYTRTETHHRTVFVGYLALQWCWLLTTTVKLVVPVPAAKYALSLATDLLAVGAIAALGYFATVYTNRSTSPRRPQNALFLAWAALAVGGIITQPVLGYQYASVSYRQEPIAYLAIEPGPMYLLNTTVAFIVVSVAFVYLGRLFLSSNHRPTSSILLLVTAAFASLSPNVVSMLSTVTLLPGYDHTAFGIVPLTVILAYTVFFRGELDLAPMARTEIVDHIDDVLFGLDDEGRVIDYNAAAERLLPADVETLVGRPLSGLLPDLAAELTLPEPGAGDASATYSTVIDGERTHYSVSASPITERGTIAGYTVVLRDITAVEASKRELSRQNEQLEAFASTVAHDLRNPLQAADGSAALLCRQLRARDDDATDEAADRLDNVSDALADIDARLDELRTLAEHTQSVTETEPIAFETAVRAVWREVDTGETVISVASDGRIDAEQGRLDSVLEQLFGDSVRRGADRVEIELTETGFTYEDDGTQIPEADTDAVFESGTTTGSGHVGLGLEVVRTQVEAQGWQIDIEQSGSRTAFVVSGATTTGATGAGT